MHIVIVGPAYPYRGGIAAFSERLALAYQQMGHQVSIHTFTLQYPNFLFPGKTQYSEDPAPTHLNIERTISSVNPLTWIQAGRKIAQLKADVVIFKFWLPFMGPCFGTIARLIKRNGVSKIIGLIHNMIPHEGRIGDRQFSRYFVTACDGYITMSQSVLNDLSLFTNSTNKKYIPHPIYDNFGDLVPKQEARQWLKIGEKEKLLLFFGIVRKYKGLDLLIKAMADPRIQEQNIKVLVAGEYYDKPDEYQALIQQHQIQDSILSKAEFIPNEAVKYYFCAADMVVQPYHRATQSGISQMAYHFERPMLVTNVGGLPEIVPDGVVGYVVPTQPKAIADAIIDFYANNKEAEFTQNVAQEKARFDWSVMAKGVLELGIRN